MAVNLPSVQVENLEGCSLFVILVGRIMKTAPAGRFEIASGEARAFIRDGVVTDTPCEVDATIRADLATLTSIAAGGSAVGAWFGGRLKFEGNLIKLWSLYRALSR